MHPAAAAAAAAAHLLATNTQPTVTAQGASHECTRPPRQNFQPSRLSSIRPRRNASVGWGTDWGLHELFLSSF